MQNRKSAKKCRLKKKAEFSLLKDDVDAISKENNELKQKVSASNFDAYFSDKRNHGYALPKN